MLSSRLEWILVLSIESYDKDCILAFAAGFFVIGTCQEHAGESMWKTGLIEREIDN